MSLIERIYQLSDYKKDSIYKISKEIGVSNGYFAKTRAKQGSVGSDIIEKIVSYYPDLNIDWLITGVGDILKTKKAEFLIKKNDKENDKENDKKQNIKKTLSNENDLLIVAEGNEEYNKPNLIPLYDGGIAAGAQSIANTDLSPQMEPAEYVDAGDWFRDATAAMRVHGDSMHPQYDSGSIVALKEVKDKLLVIYGQDYVVETSEYRVMKRLQRSDENKCWLLASVNMEVWEAGPLKGRLIHEPFDVPIDAVDRLFKVLGCVKRNESSRIVYNQIVK